MGETVDVLVVGMRLWAFGDIIADINPQAAHYGSGRRAGGVSTFICAVREDRRQEQTDDDDDEPKLVVCKPQDRIYC